VHSEKSGRLQNAPYVDNSYKWAGGGFLATAGDLCRFGDAMLFSLQRPGGYLQPYTMRLLWKPVEGAPCGWDADGSYAMGWCSIPARPAEGGGREIREYVSHTGGAVGASSVLLVMPRKNIPEGTSTWPQGVTVAIAVNMQAVGLNKLALRIAKLFEEASG
jgi:serine beta-lactamase-like protein LACTB